MWPHWPLVFRGKTATGVFCVGSREKLNSLGEHLQSHLLRWLMNTTGPHSFPLSWSTIRSTEETALQEICWLLLNYFRYKRDTVAVIILYILHLEWTLSQCLAYLFIKVAWIAKIQITLSLFPLTCIWFLNFSCDFPFHFSIICHLSAVLFHGNFNRFLMMMRRSGGLLLLPMTLLYLRSRCNKQNNSSPSLILLCFPFLCKWLHPLCYCCAFAFFLVYQTW